MMQHHFSAFLGRSESQGQLRFPGKEKESTESSSPLDEQWSSSTHQHRHVCMMSERGLGELQNDVGLGRNDGCAFLFQGKPNRNKEKCKIKLIST